MGRYRVRKTRVGGLGLGLALEPKLDTLIQRFNKFKQTQAEMFEKMEQTNMERLALERERLQIEKQQQEDTEFNLMAKSLDGLSERDCLVLEKMKDKIVAKRLGGNMP